MSKVLLSVKTKYIYLGILLCIVFVILIPLFSKNYVREFPIYEQYADSTELLDLSEATAYYVELKGFPHNYDFVVSKEQTVWFEIWVPDIESVENNRNIIIIKRSPRGPVTEITRIRAVDVTWQNFYAPIDGNYYRNGGSYSAVLEPGMYTLEVSTADNAGKYVLISGKDQSYSLKTGYKEMKQIYKVNKFFDKSILELWRSPYYLNLLILLGLLMILMWQLLRNKISNKNE